ncbi:MAG: LysE family transporter [Actinobacteria bacterium]|nr:LysE family transporter [Actinomycetota bacterium]
MSALTLTLAGLATGWGLIIAIGAQNAFVLRQGLLREHVGLVVTFCVVSDILLIGMAVAGVGVALDAWPALLPLARWAGGLFVIGYGLTCAWRARHPRALRAEGEGAGSARRAVLTVAALTWLNPHLYLDILMLGTIANSHGDPGRWWFFVDLLLASTTWFLALGYGARGLRRFFARPRSWQLLDAAIAVVMITLGLSLLLAA